MFAGLYCILVALMTTSSIYYSIVYQTPIAFVGGTLFLINDLSLVIKYFYKKRTWVGVLIPTITYYVAQYMFVLLLVC